MTLTSASFGGTDDIFKVGKIDDHNFKVFFFLNQQTLLNYHWASLFNIIFSWQILMFYCTKG